MAKPKLIAQLGLFLHISSIWVKIRLYTKNELPMLSGSALKVELVVVGGTTNNLVYPNYSRVELC